MNKKNLPKQFVRALIDKATVNKELKTFDIVFATETPVFRRNWEENFSEILSCQKDHMRTERMDGGVVPLLDNHDKYSGINRQYGSLISYSISNREVKGTIQFSTREEFAGIWGDIEAGIIRGISAAYIPWVYQREVTANKDLPIYRAIDWEVTEISMAPVPADYNSKVRSENEASYEIEIKNFNNEKNTRSNMELKETTVVEQTAAPVENQRSETAVPAVVPATVVLNADQIRAQAIAGEQKRSLDIRTAVRNAKLDEAFADELIGSGVNIDQARAQILDKMAATGAVPNIRTANPLIVVDENDNVRNAMADAIMHRSNPGSVKLEGKAHDYKYMSLLEMGRSLLTLDGQKGFSFSPSETVKRAISSTDYANLLNSVVERTIRRTYEAITPEWQAIARQITAKDFREKTGIAVDGKVTFEEISEGGEYKHSLLLTDDSAKIKLKTYGRKIKITRQAIINDDLSVFDKLPQLIAYGAADFQAAKVWGLITGNAQTPDGVAMFHANHSNLAAGANKAVVSEALLSLARTAMWRQKNPAGSLAPVAPKFLIVPMEMMQTAEKIMQSLVSSAQMDTNTMKGKFEIMTSPYLTSAVEWYLAGDIARAEGLVYAYLEGESGLFIDKETSFDDDSVTTKARLDFDCAVWDYKAWYKNPGA